MGTLSELQKLDATGPAQPDQCNWTSATRLTQLPGTHGWLRLSGSVNLVVVVLLHWSRNAGPVLLICFHGGVPCCRDGLCFNWALVPERREKWVTESFALLYIFTMTTP